MLYIVLVVVKTMIIIIYQHMHWNVLAKDVIVTTRTNNIMVTIMKSRQFMNGYQKKLHLDIANIVITTVKTNRFKRSKNIFRFMEKIYTFPQKVK